MDLNLIKNTAIGAAYKSADIINRFSGNLARVSKKGPIDLVTEADVASEENIIREIRRRFPDHEILAEESGLSRTGSSGNRWIIDPLDGTTNFAHQIPAYAISIAFAADDEVKMGVVLNPVSGELFTGIRGQKATLNGHSIAVSAQPKISESLLATGFAYDVKQMLDPVMRRLRQCIRASRGIRRIGAAALDLCFVACGRFEGFWEENLKPWDTAAGWLIAEEAGARITDFDGNPYELTKKQILATNGLIHDELRSALKI